MRGYIFLLLITLTTCNLMGQCAPQYSGIYSVRSCTSPAGSISWYSTIEARDSSQIVIRNFAGIPWDIIGVEDTVIANLNCAQDTLSLVQVIYSSGSGALVYQGGGTLHLDSLKITYLQYNPSGQQYLCYVYQKITNVSVIDTPSTDKTFHVFPNPASTSINISTPHRVAGFTITNSIGAIVQAGFSELAEISNLTPGIYVITARLADGSTCHERFLKE